MGSPDGPGLFETRQAIIDKADHADIAKLSDKYVRHEDLPGTFPIASFSPAHKVVQPLTTWVSKTLRCQGHHACVECIYA
jgi:hypothetical protein